MIEPEIDGFGGDPALSYKYTVSGRTYPGYDVAGDQDGNVLDMKPGDPIEIRYAATMPEVSCLADSPDCPNKVYDPYIFTFVFWMLMSLAGLGGILFLISRLTRRFGRKAGAAPRERR